MKVIVALVAIALTATGCDRPSSVAPAEVTAADQPVAMSSGRDIFSLDKQQLAHFSEKGLLGDGRAAAKVALYYAMWVGDVRLEKDWWLIAAQNGHIGAMQNTAMFMHSQGGSGCLRSVFWLEKAYNRGQLSWQEQQYLKADLDWYRSDIATCQLKSRSPEQTR